MDSKFIITTQRLVIRPLETTDDDFIFELLNTEGWIKFIGDRNITTIVEAGAYIQKILANNDVSFWVVERKPKDTKIGIVTYIKRQYLEHHDIGFAFLPDYYNRGYAFEATNAVLNKIISKQNISHIFATTVPGNVNSIKLLERIGLVFEKEIEVEKEKLHLYGASTKKLLSS